MKTTTLTPAQANFELALLNAEAESVASSDIYAWLRESGVPSEVAIRLKSLIDVTSKVADHVIKVGKIILIKIIEFVRAHPNLAVGMAIGAAIGALVAWVPLLGPYLAGVVIAIGAVAGHRLDKSTTGQPNNGKGDLIAVSQELIEIARAFLTLLIDILNATLDRQVSKGA